MKRTLLVCTVAAVLALGCSSPSKVAAPGGPEPTPIAATTADAPTADAAPPAAAGRSVTIAGQLVEVLPAGASPERDGRYLDESRSAKSPSYAKLLASIERDRPPGARGASTRTLVQVRRDGGVTYAYRPCGAPSTTLWITERHLWISHWESQDYRLDRARFGPDGFELAISAASISESRHPDWVPATPHLAGKIVAREPAVYEIDLWGAFSLLAVELEDLARLPLVINYCATQKMLELPWGS
ncbi:MAG TPA: hypothetical protein VNO30_47130 [Kofleriaceae bacterium]|nr:hypothetical protein [Kofleriaceae bacterium]